jgi:hypothetical protein
MGNQPLDVEVSIKRKKRDILAIIRGHARRDFTVR